MWIRLWSWKKKVAVKQFSSWKLQNKVVTNKSWFKEICTWFTLSKYMIYIFWALFEKYIQFYIFKTSEKLKGFWIKCYKMFLFYWVFFKYLFAVKRGYGSLSLDFYNHILFSIISYKKNCCHYIILRLNSLYFTKTYPLSFS